MTGWLIDEQLGLVYARAGSQEIITDNAYPQATSGGFVLHH
jgi:hypothetical protein